MKAAVAMATLAIKKRLTELPRDGAVFLGFFIGPRTDVSLRFWVVCEDVQLSA